MLIRFRVYKSGVNADNEHLMLIRFKVYKSGVKANNEHKMLITFRVYMCSCRNLLTHVPKFSSKCEVVVIARRSR